MTLPPCYSGISAIIIVISLSTRVSAETAATLFVHPPEVIGSTARYPLEISFESTDARQMVMFGLDVSRSDSILTEQGTDFSAFFFTPSSPLLDQWQPVPGSGFRIGELKSVSEYETGEAPLGPALYRIGDLTIDHAGKNLDPSQFGSLDLSGRHTVVGVEEPDEPMTFAFLPMWVVVVPEPATQHLAVAFLCAALLFRTNREFEGRALRRTISS